MEEKSIEELQAELEALKKTNLEAQLAKERAKAEEEQRLKKEEEMEALREELRQEVLDQVTAESKITKEEDVKLDSSNSEFDEFKDTFSKKLGITGEPYESYIRKLVYKEYKQ